MKVDAMIAILEHMRDKGYGNLNVAVKDYKTGSMTRVGGINHVDVGRICDDGDDVVCKEEDEGLWRECEGAEEMVVFE